MSKVQLCIGLAAILCISACGRRTEAVLPPMEIRGFQSSSFPLYADGPEGATTAAGQIFMPPEGHDSLIRVGFYCRRAGAASSVSNISMKLRVSGWEGDRPAAPALWESETIVLPDRFEDDWVIFEVPHIELKPGRKYIAWLSAVGLENPDEAAIGILAMGPTTKSAQPKPNEPWRPQSWDSAYPTGTRAFWRGSNPEDSVEFMMQAPWIIEQPGQNLHFRMVFENRRP